jgi:thioester reductase-like protein
MTSVVAVAEVCAWKPTEVQLVSSISLYGNSYTDNNNNTMILSSISPVIIEQKQENSVRICTENLVVIVPEKVIANIAKFCDMNTTLNLRTISHRFSNIVQRDNTIWMKHSLRTHQIQLENYQQFLEHCKTKYLQQEAEEQKSTNYFLKLLILGPFACTCTF